MAASDDTDETGFRAGVRASAPTFLPTLAIGVTFGVLAEPVIGPVPALVMSLVVWSGTAQFAALSAATAGAGWALTAGTGLLANGRYLPMGFAIAPSLHAPAWRRGITGLLLADASFAIAHKRSGGFDPGRLEGAAPWQYAGWLIGTATGVAGASVLTDPGRLGLDVWFPVFYLGLLIPELRGSAQAVAVAVVAGGTTLVLTPLAPPGVPVLAGVAAALLGLRRRR